jgi:hypothetical protein
MGFFIRKAFKAGPIRFNLSKSGVGVSAGVTGARLGLNKNGAYVYGGRHGLYYRERIGKKGKRHARVERQPDGRAVEINPAGPTDIFIDTGATFPSVYDLIEPHPWPNLKERTAWFRHPLLWVLIAGLFLLSGYLNEPVLWGVAGAALVVVLIAILNDYRWRKKGRTMIEELSKQFEDDPASLDLSLMHEFEEKAPKRYNERFMPDLYTVILQIAFEKPDDEHIFAYNKFEKQVPVHSEFIMEAKQAILTRALEAVLEDHLLSEEEEQQMRDLIKKLDLSDDFIFEELQYLDLASKIRKEMEQPLQEESCSMPLVRGEVCYAEFDNVRLLEERVQERFQRNRVQYRKLGYETQIEGKLILTDRRLVIAGSGSREYRLNKIADVITDLQTNLIEITIAGRKNPIFLTSEYPMLISARLEKIMLHELGVGEQEELEEAS